ncbi:MAG: redox-regulated ATPase YchF [Deltaproteobacteria bacterium]|nr:redox-regulated ATPase YchF [Deltaproteobacteria bacterium]
MGLSCGIVGLPNVGKSTLFNALTSAGALAANYPFATIEPNKGIVPVPDERLAIINKYQPTEKIIPAPLEILDIAGLVKGASKGEGLGNQFLGHIKNTDATLHLCRCFKKGDVVHVEGSVDPLRDIEIIDTELMLADLETVEKRLARTEKQYRTGDKTLANAVEGALKLKAGLGAGKPVRLIALNDPERDAVADMHLITAKPVLYVCNVGEEDLQSGNEHVEKVRARAAKEGAQVVVICAELEAQISEMPEADRPAFLADAGLKEPGLHSLARAAFALLGLQTYFTVGPKEIRAWTIPKNCKAPQAAGVIHTDFERGFIRAEVYSFDDLVKHGSEAEVKAKGLLRSEGKEYVMKDGDIVHFRFNV